MTAYGDIVDWAESRPWWQQQAIVRLASGAVLTMADYEVIADGLVEPTPSPVESSRVVYGFGGERVAPLRVTVTG